MRFSVVIPHFRTGPNSDYLIECCVKSIAAFEPELLPHTLVCDDASIDLEKIQQLQREYGIQIVRKRQNTTYSDNINLGLSWARHFQYDAVVLLNNDLELLHPFREVAEKAFLEDPLIGIVGAFLQFPTGQTQHAGIEVRRFGLQPGYTVDMKLYGLFEEPDKDWYPSAVTGAFQCVHLGRVDQIYNNHYKLSYEDVEFCLRNWEAGIRVYFSKHIRALHRESQTRAYALGVKELASIEAFNTDQFDLERIHQLQHQANCSREQ